MQLSIKLFAVARDWAGSNTVDVELPEEATVRQLREQLAIHLTPLATVGSKVSIAVNDEYATDETRLHAGDDVALIPPVSGG